MKTMIITAALSTLISLPVNALTQKEAEETAGNIAGEEFSLIESELERKIWEFEYRSDEAEMEIELYDNGSPRKVEYELIREVKEKKLNLSEKEIKEIVKAQFPDAKDIIIRNRKKRKKAYYNVTFTLEKGRGEMEISGVSGTVNEYEVKYKNS